MYVNLKAIDSKVDNMAVLASNQHSNIRIEVINHASAMDARLANNKAEIRSFQDVMNQQRVLDIQVFNLQLNMNKTAAVIASLTDFANYNSNKLYEMDLDYSGMKK